MCTLLQTVWHVFSRHYLPEHITLHSTPTSDPLPVVRQQAKMCPWTITLLKELSTFMTPSKNQKKTDIFGMQCNIVVLLLSLSLLLVCIQWKWQIWLTVHMHNIFIQIAVWYSCSVQWSDTYIHISHLFISGVWSIAYIRSDPCHLNV